MSTDPVIVIAAYRRSHSLKRLLHSVENAVYKQNDVTLIISIDHHADNGDVIRCAEEFHWTHGNKIIKTHEKNLGLRRHLIECGDYALEYGAVIILEDDVLVSPAFYEYAKAAHNYYDTDERIAGISLYSHEWNDYAGKKYQPVQNNGDAYFGQFSCTRGESWTAKQWSAFKNWYADHQEIKCDELLPPPVYGWRESWGKFFLRYIIESGKFYVIPYQAVSTVYGDVGVHATIPELEVQVSLYWGNKDYSFVPFEDGKHYDVFFENIELRKILAKRFDISEEEICIDLYALPKRKYGKKRYVLTTRKMNCRVLAQYDLNLRPHDANVLLDMEGNGIYFYDTARIEKNKAFRLRYRLEYDFAGVHGAEALSYGWIHCWRILFKCLGLIK